MPAATAVGQDDAAPIASESIAMRVLQKRSGFLRMLHPLAASFNVPP
jgi:hypothetical protein